MNSSWLVCFQLLLLFRFDRHEWIQREEVTEVDGFPSHQAFFSNEFLKYFYLLMREIIFVNDEFHKAFKYHWFSNFEFVVIDDELFSKFFVNTHHDEFLLNFQVISKIMHANVDIILDMFPNLQSDFNEFFSLYFDFI